MHNQTFRIKAFPSLTTLFFLIICAVACSPAGEKTAAVQPAGQDAAPLNSSLSPEPENFEASATLFASTTPDWTNTPRISPTWTSTPTFSTTPTLTGTSTQTKIPTHTSTSTRTLTPTRTLTRTPAPVPKVAEPCIAYYDASIGGLKYACMVNEEWKIQVVDDSRDSGLYPSLVFDPAGNAHISYYEQSGGDLKYAVWKGSAWQIETVDAEGDTGLVSSIELDAGGNPFISYLDLSTWSIKIARLGAAGWQVETVEKLQAVDKPRKELVISFNTSLELGKDGSVWVAYIDPAKKILRIAHSSGKDWKIESVGIPGFVNWFCSLALDQSGEPGISYYNENSRSLSLARRVNNQWETLEIEGNKVGKYSSLEFDDVNQPRISYFDEELDDLRYASWNGFTVFPMKMDSEGSVGVYTSLAISPRGRSIMSYYDLSNKWLKVSLWTGDYWKLLVVDNSGDVGRQSSIAYRVVY